MHTKTQAIRKVKATATMFIDDRKATSTEHRWCVVVGLSDGTGYIERFMFKSDAELFLKTFEGN